MSRTVLTLLKYKNTEKIDVFIHGEELFSSSEVLQAIENDGISWDDLKLIDYSKKSLYNKDLRDFNNIKNDLEKYKVILLKSHSYLKDKYQRMKFIIKNKISSVDTSIPRDKTIRESPKQKRLRVEGNRPNLSNFKILLEKSKVPRPIYFVNLIKTRDIAIYPAGYKGKQISGKKALNIYSRIAYKYNPMHENKFIYFSEAKNTMADNTGTETDWETVAIVKYKSFASLQDFNNEPMFKRAFVHKDAGIDKTYVYATFSTNKNAKFHEEYITKSIR